MEERWDATDECERRFRGTTLRYSSGNIGLAWLGDDLELIRVGPALRPEVAAWRYRRLLTRPRPLHRRVGEEALRAVTRAAVALRVAGRRTSGIAFDVADSRAVASRLIASMRGNRVLDLVHLTDRIGRVGGSDAAIALVRYRHLLGAALSRPAAGRPWALHLPHDHGVLTIGGDDGVRLAARLLSIVNGSEHGGGLSRELLETAVRKVEESAHPDSYFNRILALALRTNGGRDQESPVATDGAHPTVTTMGADSPIESGSTATRLALALTGRTFWGHGGIGSEPSASLLGIPLVDRVALEMAAHEESERRALEGELAELARAWREAAEIAAIADALIPS